MNAKNNGKTIGCAVLVMTALSLCGCASSKNYQAAMQTWVGAPKTAMLNEWGEPTQVTALHDGDTRYTYRSIEKERFSTTYNPVVPTGRLSPQSTSSMLSHTPPTMQQHDQTFWCQTNFIVNKSGMIVNTNYEGNNCVATKPRAQQWTYNH